MRLVLILLCLGLGAPMLRAEAVVARETIRPQTVLAPAHLVLDADATGAGFTTIAQLVGLEARTVLYAGQVIRADQVGLPALVERNAPVTLQFRRGALTILAEGRALGRAGYGETVRVLNAASRNTVHGRVTGPGVVRVADGGGEGW